MSPHSTSVSAFETGGPKPRVSMIAGKARLCRVLLVFVPMSSLAFAALSAQFRTNGAGLTNPMRNIGSAIGVSITTTLSYGLQTIYAQIAQYAAPFNRALGVNSESMFMNPLTPFGMSDLNDLMEYRAQVQAYANDFLFVFYISLPVFFVIWLMKRRSFAANAPVSKVEMMGH